MPASFTVYIDESGDEGFIFLPGERGSSRWLVLSAVVLRKRNDLAAVGVMRSVRTLLGKEANDALHFRKLRHEQRVPYARAIGQAPLRTVSVLTTRLLLERVSWLCRDRRIDGEGDGTAEITFSNRSAMSYDDLRQYLGHLKQTAEARDVRVDWTVVQPARVRAVNHDQRAGLQLADAVASGLFGAVNLTQYGESEPRYLDLIAPTLYRHDAVALGYGVKFWPLDFEAIVERAPHLAAFRPHLVRRRSE